MIEQLEIENFKSIRQACLEFGKINIFLGANGAGKTNILEAIGVISAAVFGVVDDEALLRRGIRPGVPRLYKTSNRKYAISPHIAFCVKEGTCQYKVSLLNPLDNPRSCWHFKTERLESEELATSYTRGVKLNPNPAQGGIPGILSTLDKKLKIPKAKAAKTKTQKLKTADKNYEGEYFRATNTFIYTKDNLIFPNKVTSYTVKDESGLLDGIYNFAAEKYGVTDSDLIGLKVSGTISKKDKVITIKKITNYQIPRSRILGEETVETDSDAETVNTNDDATATDTNSNETEGTNSSIFQANPGNDGLLQNEGN